MQRAQRKLISFIGLGTRTAATLLYGYIREHPEACVPETETKFFSEVKKFAQGIEWYESHFKTEEGKSLCGELASDYLTSAPAAALIAKAYPSAKLLAVIENPLLCVRVEYVEAVRSGRITKHTTLANFLHQNPEVLLRARFGRQLVNYFSYYSVHDFQVILAEDARNDQLTAIKNIYEHLGLDAHFVPASLKHLVPEEEDEKSPGLIKRTFRRLKKLIKTLFKRLAQKINPPKVVAETAVAIALRIPLSPELETYLKDYFRADVKQLSALLHRDFSVEWGI